MHAEAHEKEESSVPHEKIIDCVTSCVLLARLSDILKWQKDLVHVYLNSLAPAIPWIGMHSNNQILFLYFMLPQLKKNQKIMSPFEKLTLIMLK